MKEADVKKFVRAGYAEVAKKGSSCCGCGHSCCGGTDTAEAVSKHVGYSEEDLQAVPEGANLGLGCGNPIALASLKEGELMVELPDQKAAEALASALSERFGEQVQLAP